jgi:extradiol dioxygenase family protein
MKTQLNHIALNVQDFDWYQNFFQEVFDMKIQRERGETPARQLWFVQGIQLNECPSDEETGGIYDHLGFVVEDVPMLKELAIRHGCKHLEGKDHWFVLPNGVKVELKPMN